MDSLNNMIEFSFFLTAMKTDDKYVKKYELPEGWSKFTKDTAKIEPTYKHNGRGLITGERTGITVIDFDDMNVYNIISDVIPAFKTCKRTQTKKGIHCYFKYSNKIKNANNILKDFEHVDCKNTGGFITKEGTTYKINKEEIIYKGLDGDILDIPDEFYDLLKDENKQDNTAEIKEERLIKQKEQNKLKPIINDEEREKLYDDVDFILSKLNDDRFHEYDLWINFCFLLKNLDLTGDEKEELFIKYSSKSKKFNKYKDLQSFNNINKRDDGLTFKTLKYWFMCDNYDEYIKWIIETESKNNADNLDILKYPISREFTSGEISDHFKKVYDNKFIYCDNKLYFFNGVYYEKDDKNNSYLSNFIDSDFYTHFINIYTHNEIIYKKLVIKNQQDERLSKIKEINNDYLKKINSNFRKIIFRKSLIQDIINKITNNKQKFDRNPNLFCFNNKLYDLKQRKFIKPEASYFISMTAGYDYNDDEEIKTNNINELNKILDTIFNNEVKKSYFSVLSSGLVGELVQKFTVCSGGGGNGKSLLNKLYMETIGEYGYKLSPQILQSKAKIGACPELSNLHLKRFILTSEPDSECDINTSILKQLTGDDEINARNLFSDNTKTELFSTLVMECNDRPKFNEVNDAILRRLINIPFVSKFVDEYQYNNYTEEERKEKKIYLGNSNYEKREFKEQYKQALFDILVNNHLENYFKNGIYKSQEVINESNKYLSDSDIVFNFINENYKQIEDKKIFIKCLDLWDKFKNTDDYLKMPKISQRKLNKSEFIKRLENNLFIGKFIKTNKDKILCLYGYQEKEDEEHKTKFNGLDL